MMVELQWQTKSGMFKQCKGQHVFFKKYPLMILQNNYHTVKRQCSSTKSTLFSHIIPVAADLGESAGGLLVGYNKWSRVQCFLEAQGGLQLWGQQHRGLEPENDQLFKGFPASLSCFCQRLNLAGPPLGQKWHWDIPAQKKLIIS